MAYQDVSGLVVTASMPVRDLNMFARPRNEKLSVLSNRGASGIDGNVATAVGFARGLDQPTTLLIGDLALLHDLNSLALVASAPQPLILVVINNDGGGIFHFLPIAEKTDLFEPAFGTPHVIAGYTFIDNGRKYDVFAERYYLTCTFWGATGAHKLPARGGQCPWVWMLK